MEPNAEAYIQGVNSPEARLLSTQYRNWLLADLLLKNPLKLPALQNRLLAEWLQVHKRAADKLPTWASREGIVLPPKLNYEQASSEATARYKAYLAQGPTVVDLTGGLGIDAWALAQAGFELGYNDASPFVAGLFEHNRQVWGIEATVSQQKAEDLLPTLPDSIGTLLIDPSRRDEGRRLYHLADCTPDLTQLWPLMLKKAQRVVAKISPMLDLKLAWQQLNGKLHQIHIVQYQGEVKEVLLIAQHPQLVEEPQLIAVEIDGQGVVKSRFEGNWTRESSLGWHFGSEGAYLYDPSPVLLKAGLLKSACSQFHLVKVSPASHLFWGQEVHTEFPGRIFEPLAHLPYSEKAGLKDLLPEGKAIIAPRQVDISPEQIARTVKIAQGGDVHLFVYKTRENRLRMCLARLIAKS